MDYLTPDLSELMKLLNEKMKKESADGINGVIMDNESIDMNSVERLQLRQLITGFFFNFEGQRVFSYAFTPKGKRWLKTH